MMEKIGGALGPEKEGNSCGLVDFTGQLICGREKRLLQYKSIQIIHNDKLSNQCILQNNNV